MQQALQVLGPNVHVPLGLNPVSSEIGCCFDTLLELRYMYTT